MVEVARTSGGRWVDAGSARRVGRGGRLARRLLPLLVLLAVIGTVAAVGFRPGGEPALPDLPGELEPRAQMLARAWLDKDLPLMRRLTSTTHDRVLYSWLVRHGPPGNAAHPSAGAALTLDVRVLQRAAHQADLLVLIHGLPGRSAQSPVEFRQAWVERDEHWYFVPPAR
jgi:hypothetical protein